MFPALENSGFCTGCSQFANLNLHIRWFSARWFLNNAAHAAYSKGSIFISSLCFPILRDAKKDPAAASISDRDCDPREGETVAMNYKPSPLQVKLEKQRELARKGSLKNGTMGSPVNQQPKKTNVMARTRLVVPNKGYSSLDQSPDEKPLVALDTDSDDDFDMSRYSSSGYSSAEINQDLNIQLLKDGYRLDEIPDDEDLDLIPPKSVNPTCMCCQATSSTACHIQ
uniref:Family with sequence similarity 219 member A n=2 Tax=Colubroidea TaxID=34989 RepID=A0A8C7E5P4_NAJNA